MRSAIAFFLCFMAAQAGVAQGVTVNGTGVTLRALDKLTGEVRDLDIATGQSASFGRITVQATECRYPEGDEVAEAYAHLVITEISTEAPVYEGWMIASSPALSAMDHQRYDVWVLRCTTS